MHKNIRLMAIISAILMIVWLIIAQATLNIFTLGFYALMGMIWALISFIVEEVCIITWGMKRNPDLTEINMLPFIITTIYFLLSLIINYGFVSAGFLYYPKSLPTAMNALMIAIVVVSRLVLEPYRDRVDELSQRTIDKLHEVQKINVKLTEIHAITTDKTVRAQIYELMEQVTLSSNTTHNYSGELEEEFKKQLDELSDKVNKKASKDEILEEISSLLKLWKRRNAVSSELR